MQVNTYAATLAARMAAYQPPDWDTLPDLGLYMDQVVTYVERQLAPLLPEKPTEKAITAAMVNNYVKQGIVPRPSGKKYDREHVAALLILCALKSVLPMDAIRRLLPNEAQGIRACYEAFCAQYPAGLRRVSQALNKGEASALDCAIQASAQRMAAEALLAQKKPENEVAAKARAKG